MIWSNFANVPILLEFSLGYVAGPASIVPKKTTLHDFKKLLAQQSLGQNPHRPSAKEMLEKSAGNNNQEPIYNSSSQNKIGCSSIRNKRSSPWVDKRFSVIKEEETEGSKEELID